MGILDQLSKPPKHKYTLDLSEKHIAEQSKKYEEEELTPEEEAQLQREFDLGLHPGHR